VHPYWTAFWITTGVVNALLAAAAVLIAAFNLVGVIIEVGKKAAAKSKSRGKKKVS
jgi:hypothetical protein